MYTDSFRFQESYLQAINDLGSEELHLCKVVFFGPPGVGKSSLRRVLMKFPERERDSTGVFDVKLVQLQFKIEVTEDEEEQKSVWNSVTLNEEIKRLHLIIEKKLKGRKRRSHVQGLRSLKDVSPYKVEKEKNIHEKMVQSLSEPSTKKQKIYKTSNIMIALYDSGGQPEFFDVMPLLNTLPTGNVMIFNMNESLDAKIKPELYEKGRRVSTGSETQYTNAELMKTALATIGSCVAMHTSSTSNKVLVVGTHLDEYVKGKENEEEMLLSQMDDGFNKKVLNDATRDMIVYCKREGKQDRIVHPISNTIHDGKQDEVAQKIRTAIENMSKNEDTRKEIPNSWLLFQYQIRLLNKPCIKLSECHEIAKKHCHIKEDVKIVLNYFHKLGILLNYEILKDIVICDPQWLFDQLSKLIKAKYNPSFSNDVEKGIVKKSFMAKHIYPTLEKDTEGIIKLDNLLKLYVSFNVMAELSEEGDEEGEEEFYFMPALLDSAPHKLELSDNFGKNFYDTMYVIYKDALFPRGMFCCLVALLAQKKQNFSLVRDKQYMFKNQIVFQITDEHKNYLILSDKINYVTVEIYQENQDNALQRIFCKLLETLKGACKKMKLTFQFEFGFACKERGCQEKSSQVNTTAIATVDCKFNFCPEMMRCKECGKSVLLKYNQLLWFIPSKILNILQVI